MRSYYEHLEATTKVPTGLLQVRSTFRASAIFPVMHTPTISSRLLFMGYWMLKRKIREVTAVITLRNTDGTALARHQLIINEAKAFRVELNDLLQMCGLLDVQEFFGSLEIEFFATQNLVFPFPAVVINYYGPHFSTVVHTAQRIYNDFDDMTKNSQVEVPESGFNIYVKKDQEPFIALINGMLPVEHNLVRLHFFNHKQEKLEKELDLGQVVPYETQWIYPARSFNLEDFLDGRPGTCKVYFHVNWIFPRLLVGNIHSDLPAITITHTYYDCSHAESDADYWQKPDSHFYPASLMVPAHLADSHFTNIYFYPIYSPSSFEIDIEIYDAGGLLLTSKTNALSISSSGNHYHCLSIGDLFKEHNISTCNNESVRVIARSPNHTRLPARIKIGLDIGVKGTNAPCNICTNLQPYNPSLETKPSSFRWAPILADLPSATVWIMNSSPAINFQQTATTEVTFFREMDAETLSRSYQLSPNGFIILSIENDPELKSFFAGQIGWLTAITSNPYTTLYYFTESSSGVVGGDHGF